MFKKWNIYLFLFFCTIANANKQSPIAFELDKDPTIGKTIAIGTLIEDASDEQYFISERGWTTYPAKIWIQKGGLGLTDKMGEVGQ